MTFKGARSRARCRTATAISAAPRQRWASHAHRCTDGRQNMAYSRFQVGIALRTVALALTIVAGACLIVQTRWYVTIMLCLATVLAQIAGLVRFAAQSSREVARFLEAISFDDISLSFSGLMGDSAHSELGNAMTGVLAKLRVVRSEREEQSRYLQTL